MKTAKQLKACKVLWTFIQIEGNLSKTIEYKVAKFGFRKFSPNTLAYHSAKKELIEEAISVLKAHNKKGVATIITDKQFGMINNSWNGFAKPIAAPFTHALILKDGNMVQTVPVSELQAKKSIKF